MITCYDLEFPTDTRHSPDLFLHCPSINLFGSDLLKTYCDLVATLFRHVPRNALIDDLVYLRRNSSGEYERGSPVQMRPWEWMEYLGEVGPADAKDVTADTEGKGKMGVKRDLRNNTSMPLEMFDIHSSGEGIRQLYATSDNKRQAAETLRSIFEDDLLSESVYERHWREGRITVLDPIEVISNDSTGTGATDSADQTRSRHQTPGSYRASPALSIHTNLGSRASTGPPHSTTSSTRRTQSPAISSNRGESMDVDPPPSATSVRGKRKASVAGLSVDDPTDESHTTGGSSVKDGKKPAKTVVSRSASKTTSKTTRKKK